MTMYGVSIIVQPKMADHVEGYSSISIRHTTEAVFVIVFSYCGNRAAPLTLIHSFHNKHKIFLDTAKRRFC